VFQKANLIPFLSAEENVRIAMEINDVPAREARRRARELPTIWAWGCARPICRPCSQAGSNQRWRWRAPWPTAEPGAGGRTDGGVGQPARPAVMELFRQVAHEQARVCWS
jgi:hypothetical protein